jgi:sec-independent protein translocase protein TatC
MIPFRLGGRIVVQHSKADIPNEDLFEGTTMTFGEHLEELRGSLFRALVGLVIGFLLGLLVAKYVVQWIQAPLRNALDEHREMLAEAELQERYGKQLAPGLRDFMTDSGLVFEEAYIERDELDRLANALQQDQQGQPASETGGQKEASDGAPDEQPNGQRQLAAAPPPPSATPQMMRTRIWRRTQSDVNAMSAQEPFMIWLKAAFVTGLLIASPYIFWQLWSFVAAGLYPHEKRYVYLFLPVSLVLFWSGAAIAFFFAFTYVLRFLFGFHRALGIQSELRISEWIGFVLFLPLGFGIAFQLPLAMFFLNRIGIFTVQSYLERWRIAVVVIAIISMILTPADPISMALMATPLTLLYFLGIAMSKWMPRGRNPFTEAYEP